MFEGPGELLAASQLAVLRTWSPDLRGSSRRRVNCCSEDRAVMAPQSMICCIRSCRVLM